jgi:hypothetical protein
MSHPSLRRTLILSPCIGGLLFLTAGCQSGTDSTADAGWLLEERPPRQAEASEPADQPQEAEESAETAEAEQEESTQDQPEADEPQMAEGDENRPESERDQDSSGEESQDAEQAMRAGAEEPAEGDAASSEESDGEPATVDAERIEDLGSPLLLKPMGQLLAEAVIARREAGKPLPEDYESSDFVVSVIESLQLQHPDLFRLTEREKQRFKAGKLDDEANLRRVRRALGELQRNDVPVTTLTDYITQQYHVGGLEGVRLALAARLLEARVSAALGGDVAGSM